MHLDAADTILRELNARLDEPLSWELRREIVETLVDEITVETISETGTKEARVSVCYLFTQVESYTETCGFQSGYKNLPALPLSEAQGGMKTPAV